MELRLFLDNCCMLFLDKNKERTKFIVLGLFCCDTQLDLNHAIAKPALRFTQSTILIEFDLSKGNPAELR